MRAWVGTAVVALAALHGAGPALAQPTIAATQISVEAQRVARGLEAQYQAALIRDRRLADDRELRLIADYEARLTQARRRADSRVAGAQAELERARADYAQLVETIALRDAASRAEIEAYRAEAQGLAAEATPERLAALQRFADGDRVGAWPALETIRLAEDRAIEAASNTRRAVRWRQDAELRDIMRFNREATTEQVLALWEQAAALDPTDFWTQMNCGRLYRELGRLADASNAFTRAYQVAPDELSRITVIVDLGDLAWYGGNWEIARRAYFDSFNFVRPHANSPEAGSLIAIIMDRMSSSILTDDEYALLRMRIFLDLATRRGVRESRVRAIAASLPAPQLPPEQMRAAAEQTLGAILQMEQDRAAAYPDNLEVQRALSVALTRMASVYFLTSRYADAETLLRRALDVDRSLATRASADFAGLSVTLQMLGDALVAQEQFRDAERLYTEGLALDRRAHDVDPGNQDKARNVAVMLQRVGALHFLQNDLSDARRAWDEALSIMESLASAAPANTALAYDVEVTRTLVRLAAER